MITARHAASPGLNRWRHPTLARLAALLLVGLAAGLGPCQHACHGEEIDDSAAAEAQAAATGEANASTAAEAFRFGGAEAEKAGELPEFMRALFYRATVAFSKGDWQQAEESYRQILDKHPDNALVLTNLATVEHRTGKGSSALQHLDRAVAINPAIPQAWILKGLIHFEAGDGNLAVSALTRALHEDPLDPRPHNYLGVVIRDRGWLHGAEQELRRAIELDPAYADAHFNLALLYLDKLPPARELARRHYEKAIELGARPDKLAERKIRGDPPAGGN